MTASDYPITTDFGYIAGYPLNNGFHRGQDRAMPIGTTVIVNGTEIALSGNTGASTGPHLHIGKFIGGEAVNPNGQGFSLDAPIVFDIGNDAENGNYVRLEDAHGVIWVYLHLSKNDFVTKGQALKGGDMPITVDQVDKLIKMGLNREPTAEELANKDYQNNPGLAIDTFWNNGGQINYQNPPKPADAKTLDPGIYQVI